MQLKKYHTLSITILSLFYAVGIVAIGFDIFKDAIVKGSFLLLLLSFALLYFSNEKPFDRKYILFCTLTFTIGLSSEIIGVQTGIIFGDYYYSTVLGPKITGVPIIIGINWVMLTLSSMAVVEKIKIHWLFKALFVAFNMVLIDFFIEPVAVSLNFWNWQEHNSGFTAPWSNYLCWFLISFGINIIGYRWLKFNRDNPISKALLVLLYMFFISLNVLL